jgi:hypothetical protein
LLASLFRCSFPPSVFDFLQNVCFTRTSFFLTELGTASWNLALTKSIASGTEYATLQKYFSAVNWPLQYFLDEVLQKSTLHLILARKTAHVHSTLQEHLEQDHFAETNLHVLTFLLPILIGRVTYRALVELL